MLTRGLCWATKTLICGPYFVGLKCLDTSKHACQQPNEDLDRGTAALCTWCPSAGEFIFFTATLHKHTRTEGGTVAFLFSSNPYKPRLLKTLVSSHLVFLGKQNLGYSEVM